MKKYFFKPKGYHELLHALHNKNCAERNQTNEKTMETSMKTVVVNKTGILKPAKKLIAATTFVAGLFMTFPGHVVFISGLCRRL